jgi:glycosyltransferase involved in cell wall biosynthesis
MHYNLLREFRPEATIFKFGYPSKGMLLEPSEVKKEYDFVNFALMHGSRKGTPDSIRALALVKQKYPRVTLNIVGGCDQKGMEQLKTLVSELGLQDNVIFTPFFEKRSDLLLHVQKSHFAVLPCKLDYTSGTMTQSMQLGLPIVVYKTTGTPSFNREKQCALIAEKENVEQLAQHMMTLMENPELAETLRKNAREFQEKKAEISKQNGCRLIETFKAVIAKEQQRKDIPQELLFNPERDD